MNKIASAAVSTIMAAGLFLFLLINPVMAVTAVVDSNVPAAAACPATTDGTPASLTEFMDFALKQGFGEPYSITAGDLVKDVDAMNDIGQVPAGYENYTFAFADPRLNPDLQIIAVYVFDENGCTFNVVMVPPANVTAWIS